MKINRDSPAMRYGSAAILVALAIALRLLLDPELGGGYAFITLFLAILLTAWYGGFGPAIAAVVLGALAASYFVLAPRGSFSLVGRDERVALILYLCIGFGIAMIAGSMHAARKRAELAADVAQRRAELIDQTYDALLVWDLHGTITFWNRGAERLYGIRREDALGRVSHELLQTKVDGGVAGMVGALQRDGSWEGEFEHTNGDQRRIIVESRMTLVRDGAQVYVIEADRDVTSVRESEARLRTVTDTARVGLVIVDERHYYRYANRAYAEILNLPENNLVGLRMADVLAPVHETQIRRRLEQAFQGERVSDGLQLPPIAPGAENRHYAVSYEPGVDRSGKIVVVVVADISALKAAELKLRESLQETVNLKAALNEHAIVAITDKQGRITEVNEKFCEISKYSREELLGQDHRIINSGAHSKEFFRNLWQTIGQGKVWQGDIKNKAKDGSFYWVATTIVPFLDPDGKPRQYVAIRADITERKLAEEARARLSGIVRSSSDAIIGKSLDGIITSWNSGAEKIFGYSEAEAVGQPMRMLFPAELANDEVDILARVARDETAPHFEAQRVRKDGVRIDVSMTISPVEDSEGRIIGASTIARDITERKRAEHTAVLLAAIVDSSFDAIVGKDLQGIVTSWNAGAERMFGYTAGEIIGNSITRLIPPACHGEESRILARIKSGEGVAPFDTIRVRKDGSLVDVSVTVSPIRNAAGEVIGASKVARDVTDQKKAAKALRESEERLHTVTENLTEGLIVSDIDGQLLHWNRAGLEMHGFRNLEEGLRMMPEFAEIFDLRTLDGISMSVDRWPLARVLRGERLRDAEVRIHRRGRDWSRVFNYSGNIVHDASGKPLAFVAMSDITERKQAEEALREREEQLRLYVEHAPVAIAMFDREMKYLVLSRRWREDFRLGDQSVIGRSHYDVFPEISQNWIDIHRRCLAGAVEKCDEDAFRRGDGTTDWIRWEVRPWRQADGAIGGIIIFCEDITERKEAEDKLQASEERMRIVTDNARVGLVMVNRERRYTFANAAYVEILGLPSPDIVDQRVADVLAPIYEGQIRPRLDRAFAGERISYELRQPADGKNRYYAVKYEPTKVDGKVALVVVVITDVTERKLAEDELASSQAQLQAIFDNITEGICVIDPENDVVNMNPACRRLVGLSEPGMSRTDMIPLVEILSPNGEIVPQEDWPGHRALRGDFVQNYELVMRQKVSGRASSLEYNTAPIRDKTGKARQVIVSFRDVTERRQTEARYRTLFDYAPDGILIADPKSYYLDANASICRMLGYTRDELIGLHASNIVAPVEIPHIESALRVLTVKTDYQREWQFRRKDGSVFPAEVIATMMPDGNLMAMIRDVTERNNAALALRDKDAQIHAADRRLAEIVQGMTEACFALDTEWRFTFVNDRGESLLRHQRGEMLGRTIWEVFSKLVGTPMEANYRRAMTERVPVAFEVFSPIAERWLDIRLFPTAEGLAAFLLDIHARKLVETALRESEDQFRTMANSIPQLAWMAHADGFMFWYNQRWHDYTGTTPEQMEGWGWKSVHDPDVLPKVLEGWQGAVASGQPFEMEFPLRGADGRFRMFLTRVEPVKDSQGRVVQWFGTNTDVDELKRMEVSLRDTQARLNSTLAAGSIGTWTWDIVHDRLVADVFTAGMFSIEADAAAKGLPAEAYLRAVMEEDQPGVADGLARAIQSCGYYDIEYRVRQREGGLRWLQAKGRVEGDEAGNALNFHGAVIDITERKLADGILREAEKEKQLAYEASRLKSEFLANMSHELRTPLNCIIGFTEFLVDEKPGPLNPKQKEYLTDVHTSSRHLLQLINDVLDLAKVESGKIELYLETSSLAKAIEEVCAVVKGIAQKKSVNLQWTVTPELGLITLDQQKFKQVCYNLLSNAVKFTDAGGSVKIDALAHGGERFEVRVKDTGIGIRQEDMHRLFREFEQLESGSSRRFEGTGLGLALTKKLVESQGGSIGVESEYGTGSTFFALMPKAIAEVKSRE